MPKKKKKIERKEREEWFSIAFSSLARGCLCLRFHSKRSGWGSHRKREKEREVLIGGGLLVKVSESCGFDS